MKIKFTKEYVAVDPATNSGIIHRFGEVEEIKDYTAQWLIDNGFAEKVEQGWPTYDDLYWYVNADGVAMSRRWTIDSFDRGLKAVGNVFKTGEPAHQFIDYLKSVEVVSHDEGFMTPFGKVDEVLYGFGIFCDWEGNLCAEDKKHMVLAGEFYFDNEENAEKSIDSHPDEWKTILNYDWSKE